ncbi:hypothetical protein WA026_014235 [Henosepilachna vigintioctopunctata]|uniref:Uncharacterized protein n=1 Tax=Henosepilachna vigintioctopunctata TaxID=420089 RepID=A0AAW1TN80_9CUCU
MDMQIQEEEKPKFDKGLVNLGAFHVEMTFFEQLENISMQYLSTTNMTSEMSSDLLQTQMENTTNGSSPDINEVIELPDLVAF